MSLQLVAFLVFLINLPCGYMRSKSEKLSKNWFIWVHMPIPFVIVLRLLSGLGFQLYTFPVMVGAYFLGQFIGGKIMPCCKIKNKNKDRIK
jgi:hypothetical protein